MKNHAVRFIYTNTHCTQMGTMMTCSEPHGNDIITPGASTVATFKTQILEVARFQTISNRASSKRLNYVVPLQPTQPPYNRCKTYQKARRERRHGCIGFMYQIQSTKLSNRKSTIISTNKRKKMKQNNDVDAFYPIVQTNSKLNSSFGFRFQAV